ncbi:galactosylceramide sulfotransferase-like [Ruditapes philippinarum]|uniref:galactosylceramide sulfotransferase-like n=1 Tax=Ruditapes philippinarum TaxID=129788 RepID=UPI00295B2558|nr:galactosylceramide sulfotransferase-like [Ruditapes philippinarum]
MRIKLKKGNIKIVLLIITFIVVFIVLNNSYKVSNELYNDISRFEENLDYYVENVDYDDSFSPFFIRKKKIFNKISKGFCQERRNFVFIKTMKCATQTLVQIFRRFGYLRHLNFVLPRGNNIYIGWPFIPEKQDYRPSGREFNILTEHAVYNHTVMTKLMPKDTKYITIIREPFSHFKSTFNYFNVANISFVKETDKVSGYLQNLEKYESSYKRPNAALRYCIPDGFSVTKNQLSHCLGMPLGYPSGRENITANKMLVQDYIKHLDSEFLLVMIMEYFHESLVLLKRLLCWSMKDILYHTINVGNYGYKNTPPSAENLKIYQTWSHIDYLLYDHFNKTFWRKVISEGDDFQAELSEYNKVQSQVSNFCSDLSNKNNVTVIEESPYSDTFTISKDYCLMLGIDLLEYLKRRFDREEAWSEPENKTAVKRGC